MKFNFSPNGLTGREKKLQRFFEILPGATSWCLLIGVSLLSFWRPVLAAIVIIVFDFYWLLRLFYLTIFLAISYALFHAEKETDWMGQCLELDRRSVKALSNRLRRREIRRLIEAKVPIPPFESIRHLVILPVSRERQEVMEPALRGLCHQTFPTQRILMVVALEDRAQEPVKEEARLLAERYKKHFLDFLLITHPDGLPGEARVKGANITYAARAAAVYLKEKQIPFEHVIASCFDADTVVDPQYFACLAYHFMACPDRARASFQPIPLYHNNIWEAPSFARVLETGSSFFLLIEATNPEKLVTFSSHSLSFQALVETGYWPVDMISDDSAIFWKAFIHFDGDYRVVPMYVTVSMDVVTGKTWWRTIRNIYRQKRRWAWGVENFPLVARAFLSSEKISRRDKVRHLFKLFESHVAWATWAFLLTFIGWIPALFAGREFSNSVLYYSSARITGIIFNLSLLSFFISIFLSWQLLPEVKTRHSFLKKLSYICEWVLVPFIATFLSAMPALDAQTRFALGKPLRFQITEKSRKR